nr:MAG TPA: hypothetical protein [Caudoviricetes sp.]
MNGVLGLKNKQKYKLKCSPLRPFSFPCTIAYFYICSKSRNKHLPSEKSIIVFTKAKSKHTLSRWAHKKIYRTNIRT